MKKKAILWGLFLAWVLFLFLSPHQNIKIADILNTYQPPSADHWFGTDNLGRDLYSLMITGGQRTLLVVLIATLISFTGGTLLGMISAYYGGPVRTLVQFLSDFTIVVPSFIVALIFSALFGFSPVTAGVLFGIGNMGQYVNLSEGLSDEIRNRDFIRGEIGIGLSTPGILFRHILPNIARRMLVYMGNNASSVVLQYAGLAFIGLGTDQTNPDWGTLLYSYRQYMLVYPRLVVIPIAAICLLALFFHFAFDEGSMRKEELTIYD